jgi:hypothetical protein
MIEAKIVSAMPTNRDTFRSYAFVVAAHLAAFLAFSTFGFLRSLNELFILLDGTYTLTIAAHQFAWLPPAAGYFASPFQGLGDVWFPINSWLIPGFLLPHLVLGSGSEMEPGFRVGVYVIISLESFIATFLLARALGVARLPSILSAWLTPLLIMPIFGPSLIYVISQLVPHAVTAISETCLIVAAIASLGRAPDRPRNLSLRDVLLVLAILALAGHLTLSLSVSVILCLPVVVFGAAGCIAGAEQRRELVIKLTGLATVAAVLIAAGFAAFLLGIFTYSAPYFWASQFENDRMSWYFLSIFFHKATLGRMLFLGGLFGLLLSLIWGGRREKRFAAAVLALIAVLGIAGVTTSYVDFWRGPAPLYFEFFLWPLYAIFAVRGAGAVLVWVARRLSVGDSTIARFSETQRALALFLPLILALGTVGIARAGAPRPRTMFPLPPTETRIVSFLKDQIALLPGRTFRGRVATMEMLNVEGEVGWLDMHVDYQAPRTTEAGNDHHLVGLWHFDIPTLLEYSSNMSPAFFRAVTRFVARRDDRQMRSTLVLRNPNARLLGFLGVRFLIADAAQGEPFRLMMTDHLRPGETLYLYEVPDVNLGSVSPGEIRTAGSFDSALDQIVDSRFDIRRHAILIDAPVAAARLKGLKPVDASELRVVERGGIVVKATSAGTSLLVIPFEFSHCLTVRSWDDAVRPPGLIRVNAMLTGVLFDHAVNAELRYFTGPFSGATCRLRDADEFKRLIAG